MESLANYGSDDEYEESSQSKRPVAAPAKSSAPQDDNYEEVQMDLSEDSVESTKSDDKDRSKHRSDRKHDRHRRNRDDKRTSHRDRSRSPSRRSNPRNYPRRYDRASNKMAQLEKLGIEIKAPDSGPSQKEETTDKNRFYMPGITGRFTDQIQKRKMLWQKKAPEKVEVVAAPPAKQWENTTFAQDSDGKVANKFKRLMGIKSPEESASKSGTDTLRKQEEMFSSMEQQYEVARTATHTMRGVGLGFTTFQR